MNTTVAEIERALREATWALEGAWRPEDIAHARSVVEALRAGLTVARAQRDAQQEALEQGR